MISTESVRRVRQVIVRSLAVIGVAVVGAVGLVAMNPGIAANAAGGFQAGNIISDSNFYNGAAMTESQIQSFLVSKGSVLANHRTNTASRPAYISDQSRPGYKYCDAFQGGSNVLASTLIYRAQVACNISAKVILVTLEKEQSLVTRSTASTGVLNIAMGYGCPDTAPCQAEYFGLGNQVYLAARQFQLYKLPENNFRYQKGSEYIQYHPNAACGGTTVNVRNWATAGLYNYTPYQPNAASLAAFPGVGNSCSSYGNRNFFFMYNAWFGAPNTADGAFEINEAYRLSGGSSGSLGAEVNTLNCAPGQTSCWQEYVNGYITWTSSRGAFVSSGDVARIYKSFGGPAGPVGFATSDIKPVVEPTHGNGDHQLFSGGVIHKSASGTFLVPGLVQDEYSKQGWVRGELGWPITALECGLQNGCLQKFQNGSISYVNGSVLTVSGAAETLYRANGGPAGLLGYPTSSTKPVVELRNGNGVHQFFEGGVLHSSAAGTFVVLDPILAKYSSLGWVRGDLGWPAGDVVCGLPDNGCSQEFQHGTIYVADGHPAQGISNGPMATYYASAGGPAGSLGYPTSSTKPVVERTNGNGVHQFFEGGVLHSSAAGAFVVSNPILAKYSELGWVRGKLGWPAAEQVCGLADGGCSQEFQYDDIHVLP